MNLNLQSLARHSWIQELRILWELKLFGVDVTAAEQEVRKWQEIRTGTYDTISSMEVKLDRVVNLS